MLSLFRRISFYRNLHRNFQIATVLHHYLRFLFRAGVGASAEVRKMAAAQKLLGRLGQVGVALAITGGVVQSALYNGSFVFC